LPAAGPFEHRIPCITEHGPAGQLRGKLPTSKRQPLHRRQKRGSLRGRLPFPATRPVNGTVPPNTVLWRHGCATTSRLSVSPASVTVIMGVPGKVHRVLRRRRWETMNSSVPLPKCSGSLPTGQPLPFSTAGVPSGQPPFGQIPQLQINRGDGGTRRAFMMSPSSAGTSARWTAYKALMTLPVQLAAGVLRNRRSR